MIVTILLQYYTIICVFYWYHYMLHCPWSGPFYRMHYVGHHKTDYPVHALQRNDYIHSWQDDFIFTFPCAMLIFIGMVFSSISFVILSLVVFVLAEIFHSSYHLMNVVESHPDVPAWLHNNIVVKLPGFEYLRRMHNIHHARRNINFGIFDFQMDMLFGTHCNQEPNYLKRMKASEQAAAASCS